MFCILQKILVWFCARHNLNWTISISLLFIILGIFNNYNFIYPLKNNKMMKRLSKLDPSSYSTPELAIIEHIDFNWKIDFSKHIIKGTANLNFKVIASPIEQIFLDVLDIKIDDVSVADSKGLEKIPLNFYITDNIVNVGSKLVIDLPTQTDGKLNIIITYETSSKAAALQWLTPEQTIGKKYPYLFSQCQAINARSLVPCQDTPYVKFTFNGTIEHDPELTALMGGVRVSSEGGKTEYEQKIPIPSYLLALAVGRIVSRPLGPVSKVWGEEEIIDEAANEFSETDVMLKTAVEICGPYVWKTYDLLIMPPSFPFGGMENPCLTFVTPTILAGDKSLADVIAHEIAHSWTGNLVTNENFEHFWLNEGFTVFVEGKIIGRMRGEDERDFHAIRNTGELKDCIQTQLAKTPELTRLVVDLSECSPEDAFSTVPYVKGQTFLRYLETLLGGPTKFEIFLRSYLKKFQYKSINTNDFRRALYDHFEDSNANELSTVDWDLWLYGQGMPPIIPKYITTLADDVYIHADLWINSNLDKVKTSSIILNQNLTSLQIIELLTQLLLAFFRVECDWLNLLETSYKLNETKNSEINFRFFRLCILAKSMDRMDAILAFANSNFRMKFVRPIYRALGEWPEARPIAIDNFNKVKDQMMASCVNTITNDLGL